jgi:hypothetical protein
MMVFLGCRFKLLCLLFKVFKAGSFALHKQCQMLRVYTHFMLISFPAMYYRGIEACFESRLRARRSPENAIILTPRQWIDSNSSAISASYWPPIFQPSSGPAWIFSRTPQSRGGSGIMSTLNRADRTSRSVERRTDRSSSTTNTMGSTSFMMRRRRPLAD